GLPRCGAADTGEELLRVERLRDVVVRAQQEPGDSVGRIGSRPGHEDDRELFPELVAELAADLIATRHAELDVEDDHIRALAPGGQERLIARPGFAAAVARTLTKHRY